VNELYKDIDSVIARNLSGNMSLEEKKEFELWLKESEENEKLFQSSKKVWEQSNHFISPEQVRQDKLNILHKVQTRQTVNLSRTRRLVLLYKLAAILAIPITFAISWYFLSKEKTVEYNSPEMFCEVAAPKGHVAKCVLPDGSQVWVNTNSTITYNTASFNQKNREIHLKGEAYFEVAKNTEKPFTVVTPMANIKVTGTAFNVQAYADNKTFEAVLAEGSIEMTVNDAGQQKIDLVPGERAIYNAESKKISISRVEPEYYSSWRTGDLLFKDATLDDLIVELERFYDIKIHLRDKELGDFRFRGMFSYNNNLIEALEKIKKTAQIDYYIVNKEVWLTKAK